MRKELKIILPIFLLSILLFLVLYSIKQDGGNYKTVSPFSKNSNIFSFFSNSREKPKKIIYGYLPYWNISTINYLQLDKITDIAYFGLYLNGNGTFKEMVEGEDGSIIKEPGYLNWKTSEDVNKLINDCKNKGIRFSLTIIAHADEENDAFLNCRECWDTLLSNLKLELDEKGIRDVNLNFEHAEGTDEGIDQRFSEFTKFLNDELDKTYGNSYLVVSAFGDSATQERVSSDLDNLGRNADGIFIMAYDYHRPLSDTVGPVSPIEGPGGDVTETINDFLTKIPPSKIILGLPYYGYNWLVEDDGQYSKRVEGSNENGFSQAQSYESVMNTIIETKSQIKWNEEGKSPYFTYISPETSQLRTAYYENSQSLKAKYDLINSNNLGGVGIWALGYDGGYTELWDALYDSFIKN